MAAVVGAGAVLSSPRILHAEEPVDGRLPRRKPIYDENLVDPSAPSPTPLAAPSTPTSDSYRPTPTDRLAVYVGHARMALYRQAIRAEDAVNSALTETLRLERSFTSTIRSLGPPKESSEKVVPGILYVLVASMAGSIVTRNRNILLRTTIPAAIGVGAAYAVLPTTMANVGQLLWSYEERYPVLADTHLRTKERITRFWETGKAHSAMTVGMVQDKVGETREKLEDWVKKGK